MKLERLKKDYILFASLILLAIITLLYPQLIMQYPSFIDWNTIFILATLFLITTALKDSGYLDLLARKVIKKIRNERNFAVILVILSFFLSMVVTNDVTLLVIIPFTLSLQKYLNKDLSKIIIFEAIAVNSGSILTPIGNPQNIYLWHMWGIGFFNFIAILLPLSILMLVLLLIFIYLIFPRKTIQKMKIKKEIKKDKILGIMSIVFLLVLIAFMHLGIFWYLVPIVFISYAIYGRESYKDVDWALIIIFILFFLNFNALGHIPAIKEFLKDKTMNGASTFIYASVFSQFMSNVPAAILLSNFTKNFKALVYGVSVGGNGTIIASLANLIALRFIKDKKWIIDFHKYSISYFLLTFTIFLLFYYIIF